jgi:hypothetical protein
MEIKPNTIVSETELQDTLKKYQQLADGTNKNVYDVFIEEKKKEEASIQQQSLEQKIIIEKHHILPRFDGGQDTNENIIFLTIKDHVIAHWLRWQVLNKSGDKIAFYFRINDTENAVKARLESISHARQKDRLENKGFFNSDFQREMGLRGGSSGGLKNTPAQYAARQKVGQTYGRETGISNQKETLKDFVGGYSIWSHSKKHQDSSNYKVIRNDETFFLVSPKKAFVDIVKVLADFVPDSIPINNAATMHALVYQQRKFKYGWCIVEKLTRSELMDGLQNFYKKNPNIILNIEQSYDFYSDINCE